MPSEEYDTEREVFEELLQLGERILPPEGFKREADRIRGKILPEYISLRTRVEHQLNFIEQNLTSVDRKTTYEMVDNTLVATGWSVHLSEALMLFNGNIHIKGIVLQGAWNVILDKDVVKIPGVCLTIKTNILDVEGNSDGTANDGRPTCTIDTSGANGEPVWNGEDGTQGASMQRGRPGGNGQNGTAGQSAGHVTIKARYATGGTVQVIANGGDGGNGGNGGNGKDGVDGVNGRDGRERGDLESKCYFFAPPGSTVLYAEPYDPVLPGFGGHAGRGGAPGDGGLKEKVNIPSGGAFLTPCSQDGRIGQRGKDGKVGKMGKYGNPGKGCILKWRPSCHPCEVAKYEWFDGYPLNKSVGEILDTDNFQSCGDGIWITWVVKSYSLPPMPYPKEDEIMIDGKIEKRSNFSGNVVGAENAVASATESEEISFDTPPTQALRLRELMPNRSLSQ